MQYYRQKHFLRTVDNLLVFSGKKVRIKCKYTYMQFAKSILRNFSPPLAHQQWGCLPAPVVQGNNFPFLLKSSLMVTRKVQLRGNCLPGGIGDSPSFLESAQTQSWQWSMADVLFLSIVFKYRKPLEQVRRAGPCPKSTVHTSDLRSSARCKEVALDDLQVPPNLSIHRISKFSQH